MKPSITLIERACRSVWSPAETASVGGWVLVRNGGFTRRLNSSSAHGPAAIDRATWEAIVSWISGDGGGVPPIRVTPLSHGPTMAAAVPAWGLDPVDETLVLTRPLRSRSATDSGVALTPLQGSAFMDDLMVLNGYGPATRAPLLGIMERVDLGTGLSVPGAAVAIAGVVDAVCCVFSLAVAPAARGQGLASAVVERACAWGHEQGATHAALQVLGTNAPARRLYERLGFEAAYTYHYLEPRTAGPSGS